jgi:HTH-type transcriptional regulator, glycine betaine synthesis regulator
VDVVKQPGVDELPPVVRRFIEEAGNTTQSLGVGRVLGQIYAYLYFSREPRNLADLQKALGISKGGASMGVRQLEQWSAVRKVWVKGDRRDYYEANDWFGKVVRNAVLDTMGKRLSDLTALLNGVGAESGDGQDPDDFISGRIEGLRKFHRKVQSVWNARIVRILLK